MSAVSAIETLRALGAESISAKTHISLQNVRALLDEEFDRFAPVQFSGFVTILEREYGLDLSEWRQRYAQQKAPATQEEPVSHENDPFVNAARASRHHRRTITGLVVLLVLSIGVTVFVLGGNRAEEKIELNNTAIEAAQKKMASLSAAASSKTATDQVDAIQAAHQSEGAEAETTPEAVVYDDVIIRPRTKVWLGVIDAQTRKRYTRTTAAPWRLDGSKAWLIVTGHGLLSLECGGIDASFAERDRLLFLYEDGKCRRIDAAEFKARNRGRIW